MTFNPTRLTLARKRRGLTKAELAKKVNLTTRSISAYENGEMLPSSSTVGALSRELKFPENFFVGPNLIEPTPESASFRALSSMTASQRDAALGAGALAILLGRWIEDRFQLPNADAPRLQGFDPETAADEIRLRWRLGVKPVRNVIHLFEAHGIRVFSLAEECSQVDAFSLWVHDTPYIFLNTMKSSEHSRFDAAHELGHLVLHSHGGPHGRDAELEANKFASAFLMPRTSVLAMAPRATNLKSLIKLKKVWNVSVAALAHRLHSLKLLSDWHYRTIYIEMSRLGYRKTEPEGIERETSQLLNKVFTLLREDGLSRLAIASELQIDPRDLNGLVFGLIMTQLNGGQHGDKVGTAPKGKLQLVYEAK